MYSLLIKNATVIDGTGKPGVVADVACEGPHIVNIGQNISTAAKVIIDGTGKILAPGFIDIQNHSDSFWQLFDSPSLDSLVSQGFTTILVGNCGASLAPLLSRDALLAMQKWHNLDGINTNWQSFDEFAHHMSNSRFGCNVASLVGYATLRRGLIGDQVRALEKVELEVMEKNLEDALIAGAFGLSTGLAYAHEAAISDLELYALAKIVSKYNRLFSVHLRNESADITASLEEALEIARQTDLNLKISHFKVRGKENYPYLDHLIGLLETESHKGMNVHFDVYPYDTTWQVLFTYLPKWAIEGGRGVWNKHLADPTQRNKILSHLSSSGVNFEEIIITSTTNKLNVMGKKLSEVAKNLEIPVEEAVLQIIEKGGSEVMVFDKNLDPEQVKYLTHHPLGIISTDGGGFSLPEKNIHTAAALQNRLVHPRCFGAAAKFIKNSIEDKELPLENVIWKLSGLPAKKIGLQKRGLIKTGYFADLVMFDPKEIKDNSTLQNPYQLASGVEYVFVNGSAKMADQKLVSTLPGEFLKKS